jgi:hypothetical protein
VSERIERVRVTNRNTFEIRDMHDGVPYEFPPGQTVTVPPEAAMHIFGWPGEPHEMAAHMARRFGWNRPEHYTMPKDEQAAQAVGIPYPYKHTYLPWQYMTAGVILSVEHYEMRRVHAPGAPIPAEEAGEAPDMLGLNVDPPPPRRTVVGRRRGTGKPRKKVLRPRVQSPAPAGAAEPVAFETTEPTNE